MKITKYKLPFGGHHVRNEVVGSLDSVFDKFFNEAFPDWSNFFGINAFSDSSYPKVDILDCEKCVKIFASVPGLDKKDVNVEIVPQDGVNVLTISGSKNSRDECEVATFIRKELKRSAFTRSFTLGENLDPEQVNAEFKNGILELEITKKEEVLPPVRKIKIK